jgi:hypothetical protein
VRVSLKWGPVRHTRPPLIGWLTKKVVWDSQVINRVFPPFHWVFLEGKREKERKKKRVVKILVHFNVPLHGL